jgi:hypothetical protein
VAAKVDSFSDNHRVLAFLEKTAGRTSYPMLI